MSEHRASLEAPVLLGVGAAFDMHSGGLAQAPRWMRRSGLEWLFRLWQEPRRLWYRYLVYNPLFVFHVLLEMLGVRRYGGSGGRGDDEPVASRRPRPNDAGPPQEGTR